MIMKHTRTQTRSQHIHNICWRKCWEWNKITTKRSERRNKKKKLKTSNLWMCIDLAHFFRSYNTRIPFFFFSFLLRIKFHFFIFLHCIQFHTVLRCVIVHIHQIPLFSTFRLISSHLHLFQVHIKATKYLSNS